MAERDSFWSIHIANSYSNNESPPIKNLIDFPYSSDLKNLDSECARLYAIVMLWLTTASHREVRDKATKSAIIILSEFPEHLLNLMDQFVNVNDLYVLERLYAIAYGVIVNIEDKNIMKTIAEKTYEQVFKMGKPVPHISLRNYARCILDFAYNKKLLSDEIKPSNFHSPYKNTWSIENSMKLGIDNSIDSKNCGAVHGSIQEFMRRFEDNNINCSRFFKEKSFMEESKPTIFSTEWVERWVCKQSYAIGWGELLEKNRCSMDKRGSRKPIEILEKKYQWIAFHRLLAYLKDNADYIRKNDNISQYGGDPGNISFRDIDPTCLLRKTKSYRRFGTNSTKYWWNRFDLQFPEEDIKKQEDWLKLKNHIPFNKIFEVKNPKDGSVWIVLGGDLTQNQKHVLTDKLYEPSCSFNINSIIISKKDRTILCEKLKNKHLHIYMTRQLIFNTFLKEYPYYDEEKNTDWIKNRIACFDIQLKYLHPIITYRWSTRLKDNSIDEDIYFYLPSKTLIDKLNLYYPPKQFENWVNSNQIPVFKNPSLKEKGPSYPLIKKDVLCEWLNKENLCLVWLIGGQKSLCRAKPGLFKNHNFSGVYFTNGDQIEGNMWFLDIQNLGR
ncbi:MAG: hypothetical protein OXM55_02150 [Bdellovibrionales bacterium]|nr:hypothetical protein [Bdellovibrionales bacterium]